MKTEIILKSGQRVKTHAETAKLLIEMGRARTPEEAVKADEAAKQDKTAETRQTKVIGPEQNKAKNQKRRK